MNGTRPDGSRFLPDAPEGTFIAIGLDHNIILVVSEWEMVMVRAGTDRDPPMGHPHVLNHFLRRLGMAVYALETEE